MLEARVDKLELAIQRLAEAQARTEQHLADLAARVDQLTVRMDQVAARVDQLTEAQIRTEQRLNRLIGVVGEILGELLETRYREKAAAYFQQILRGIRAVPREELEQLANEAEIREALSKDDHVDLLLVDLVVRGQLRDRGVDGYLVVEVSSVIDSRDVERASRRARLLERIVASPVVPAVVGGNFTEEAERDITSLGVWRVLDGQAIPLGSPSI
ncbi:MAG: hypothetical protein QN198_06180 [Armatimonadota bacterium]|nr:hypothetical protein [Armatimonadota bacterium]MDR5703174.1 hypothetical protein [Armatimonadota bacterium]MDR7435001.1 hypothetical protein [Armatimonadota bacterium]